MMAHYDHSSTHVTWMTGYEFLLIPGYKTVHLSSNETIGDKRAYVCLKKKFKIQEWFSGIYIIKNGSSYRKTVM